MIAQCTHCEKTFSTEEWGVQTCPHCGTLVQIDDPNPPTPETLATGPGDAGTAPPGPAAMPPPDQGETGTRETTSPPWERRDELGLVGALVETTRMGLLDPTRLFQNMRPTGQGGSAFLYGWLVSTIGAVVAGLWGLLMPQDFSQLPPEALEALGPSVELMKAGAGIGPVLAQPILQAVSLIVWVGIVHVTAMVFGAADKGFDATMRAISYAQAPQIIGVVPVIGPFVGLVWSLGLQIFALMHLQKTTGGKAAAVILVWVLSCCLCLCFSFVMLFSMILQGLQGMPVQ